jgi:2-C-methyl-D-erythritol 4-phosphate cytidylyltransferase
MEKYVLIVAGGKGIRMKSDTPKQFVELNNKPLLMQTIDAFPSTYQSDQLILVIPNGYLGHWKELCAEHQFHTPHNIIEGGPHRYYSVKRGLSLIPDTALVAIHDAVRPFVSKELINQGFSTATKKGNAIPAIGINESLREISGSLSKAVNRDLYRKVQTPQFFHASLIKKAYQQPFNERFTDDATVLESSGQQIYLFDGEPANIKITTPGDLLMAEAILRATS